MNEGNKIRIFWRVKRFLLIMLGGGDPYFMKDDLLFPLRNCLPDITAAKRAFLLC